MLPFTRSLRSVSVVSRRFFSLPSHNVVGMPSLSPTMEVGTISSWLVKPGDKITPGVALAEVETDKATMTFEAQDDFIVAKLLVKPGSEVKVGEPIMVSVEDEADVAAFENFEAPKSASAPVAAAPKAEPTPAAPKAAPTPAPKAAPTPAPKAEPTPAPVAPKAAPTPAPAAPKATPTGEVFVWGSSVKKSPLYSILSKNQSEYIKKYGATGHIPH